MDRIYHCANDRISIQFGGIISTVIFFLWTNFGVVLTTSMYPKTIEGLGQSYINGLPFITNQLAGNLIIVPALFVFTYALININFKLKFDKVKNILIKPKF
ncbi:MAG: hypothetical protein US52_C0002G0002 [candidate division WS6 bacterium GW2011_GWA2_37_6]|uniref:Uncharacterized protein n=1 Tax=candidate division WS6 bacterium GW2011_GWA2_37_6 TaxID=1619087 RepID=A0A0G0JHP9_9BACT|nr:MAG: hypothetical protein US52_C0002G0002 [candidate division WS6 bacterium GW2011_GWA2_37_6]